MKLLFKHHLIFLIILLIELGFFTYDFFSINKDASFLPYLLTGILSIFWFGLQFQNIIDHKLFKNYMVYGVVIFLLGAVYWWFTKMDKLIFMNIAMIYMPLHTIIMMRCLLYIFFPKYPSQKPTIIMPTKFGFYYKNQHSYKLSFRDYVFSFGVHCLGGIFGMLWLPAFIHFSLLKIFFI